MPFQEHTFRHRTQRLLSPALIQSILAPPLVRGLKVICFGCMLSVLNKLLQTGYVTMLAGGSDDFNVVSGNRTGVYVVDVTGLVADSSGGAYFVDSTSVLLRHIDSNGNEKRLLRCWRSIN